MPNDAYHYRVMICIVGEPPNIQFTTEPFLFTKRIIDRGTIETVRLDDGVHCYFDEEYRHKNLPFNRSIPARMPILPDVGFVIDTTDGNHPAPGEMGEHRIHGNFMLLRHNESEDIAEDDVNIYADLTDADIAKYTRLFT